MVPFATVTGTRDLRNGGMFPFFTSARIDASRSLIGRSTIDLANSRPFKAVEDLGGRSSVCASRIEAGREDRRQAKMASLMSDRPGRRSSLGLVRGLHLAS